VTIWTCGICNLSLNSLPKLRTTCSERNKSTFCQRSSWRISAMSLRKWEHWLWTGWQNSTTSSKCGLKLYMFVLELWTNSLRSRLKFAESTCRHSVSRVCTSQASTRRFTHQTYGQSYTSPISRMSLRTRYSRWSNKSWWLCNSRWLCQASIGL